MRTVRYHPEARTEFLHEVGYYAAISVRLAEHYDGAVHTAETHAATTPETWPKYKHNTRRIVDRQFKFSLVYLHNENEVQSSPSRQLSGSPVTGGRGSVTHDNRIYRNRAGPP